uniref:G_PROTEIN_RECEP_F1_2 domain-containing protein n=1 Tax=Panagrellus redivivus TaxID=6233 RepID=A0A7E4W0V0_PANRE
MMEVSSQQLAGYVDWKLVNLIVLVLTAFIANFITLCIFFSILYRRRTLRLLQPQSISVSLYLNIFIWVEIVYCMANMVYMGNIGVAAILFQPSKKNAYLLWITGTCVNLVVQVLPVTLTFLTIERCFGIRLPVNSFHKRHTVLTYCYYVTVGIVIAVLVFGHLVTAFPKEPLTSCNSIGCIGTSLGNRIYTGERVFFGMINVTMSIILMFLIRSTLTKSQLAVRVFKVSLLSYAPFSAILTAIDNLIVAFVYRTCFKKAQITPFGQALAYLSSSAKQMVQINQF